MQNKKESIKSRLQYTFIVASVIITIDIWRGFVIKTQKMHLKNYTYKSSLKDCKFTMFTNKSLNVYNVVLSTQSVFWKPPALAKAWVMAFCLTSHLQTAVLPLYSWWTDLPLVMNPPLQNTSFRTQRACLPSNRTFHLHQPASESDKIIYKSCLSSCDHETAQLLLTVQGEFRWFLALFFICQTEELKLKAASSENHDDDLVCTG